MRLLKAILVFIILLPNISAFALEMLSPNKSKFDRKTNTSALLALYAEVMADRQSVLAENVANANTPGYKAEDMDINKIGEVNIHNIDLKVTNKHHIAASKSHRAIPTFKTGGEKKMNGNDVNLPEQMAKIAANQDKYNETIKNYMVTNNLISTVLGSGAN